MNWDVMYCNQYCNQCYNEDSRRRLDAMQTCDVQCPSCGNKWEACIAQFRSPGNPAIRACWDFCQACYDGPPACGSRRRQLNGKPDGKPKIPTVSWRDRGSLRKEEDGDKRAAEVLRALGLKFSSSGKTDKKTRASYFAQRNDDFATAINTADIRGRMRRAGRSLDDGGGRYAYCQETPALVASFAMITDNRRPLITGDPCANSAIGNLAAITTLNVCVTAM